MRVAHRLRLLLALAAALAAGCAADGTPDRADRAAVPKAIPTSLLLKRPGGFYNDDAPDGPAPVNLDVVPDAQPRPEPLNSRANEPYTVFGKEYVPYKALVPYRRHGTVSWYGRKFHGQRTWGGEVYDMYGMTAAHPTLPIPSYVRIRNLENGRTAVVRINDRGPFHSGRVMDVSYAAAHKLGFARSGTATVEVESFVFAAPEGARTGTPAPAPAVAAAEPPEPAPVVATAAERHGVFLQLGAFGTLENAHSFQSKIGPQLAELKLGAEVVTRAKLHRVHVGPFGSKAEAAQAAQQLRESLGIKAFVVVR